MGRWRLFIAVPTPPHIVRQVAQVREELRAAGADVRWEPDEKLHATLKFLGDTEETTVPRIEEALSGIAGRQASIPVDYRDLGAFPDVHRPRVLWVGMGDATGALTGLQREIDAAMSSLGFPREDRPFHAHLTLGRVKGPRNLRVLLTIMESSTLKTEQVTIRSVELVRSTLRPEGSVYTVLHAFPFGG